MGLKGSKRRGLDKLGYLVNLHMDDEARSITARARATLERLAAADLERETQARERRLAKQFSSEPPNPSNPRAWDEYLDSIAPPEPKLQAKQEPGVDKLRRAIYTDLADVARKAGHGLLAMNTELRAHISERIDALVSVLGEESGRNEKLLREEMRAEFMTEIAKLRAPDRAPKSRPSTSARSPVLKFRLQNNARLRK